MIGSCGVGCCVEYKSLSLSGRFLIVIPDLQKCHFCTPRRLSLDQRACVIMPRPSPHVHDSLSNSPAGESYMGLGCFPLGQHITHTDVSDLVSTLHHLRRRKLLPALPAASLIQVRDRLRPLYDSMIVLPKTAFAAVSASKLRDILEDLDTLCGRVAVFTFADSRRLSCTAPHVCGLFGFDVNTRATYLYISATSGDVASTILHTYMSSRKNSRLQCLLAEYILAEQTDTLTVQGGLPSRFEDEIDELSYEEIADFMERLEQERHPDALTLFAKLTEYCEIALERKKEQTWWSSNEQPWP